jgi:hypothetical protein
MKDQIRVPEDFDAMLSDDILELFESTDTEKISIPD